MVMIILINKLRKKLPLIKDRAQVESLDLLQHLMQTLYSLSHFTS